MKISEIFSSIEGEGKRVGLPATFIRTFGCDMACTYCDSKYAWAKTYEAEAYDMTVDEILEKVKQLGIPNITITGGEPLLQPDFADLLHALEAAGYWVNVETNGGHIPITTHSQDTFYTMDFKTYSSRMTDRMNRNALAVLGRNDVLKFVVGDANDLRQTKTVLDELKPSCQVYISPVFGKIEPKKIVEFMLAEHMHECHIQLQLHKYLWDPNQRGV